MITMAFSITISDKYSQWRDFLLEIPQRMDSEGTWIYGRKRNLIKSFVTNDGTTLVVKRYHKPRGINLIVYSSGMRKPKGERAYLYAEVLNEHGVDTPEAVAYIEHRSCGLLLDSYLITMQCPYRHRLYEMGDATPDAYELMAEALAAFTAHMHNEGILHLDFSPGNILWDKDSAGNYHFSLVDINRMRFGKISMEAGCKNFARLWGPKAFIISLSKHYARLRGFNEDEAVKITLDARRKFWTRHLRHNTVGFKLEI